MKEAARNEQAPELATATTRAVSPSERREQLTAAWDVRGIDIETVVFESGTAIARRRSSAGRPWAQTLPTLLAPGSEGEAPQFRLGEVLGEGGMGVVRTAEQVALGRQVAIKTTRKQVDPGEAVPQLLREARVTGVLEHPNVVPIYAFGRDDDDRPLLVMRRVQGESWGDRLFADAEDRASDGYLRRHLDILKQVALAVHFAHDKGIVHRDLKPDNVMVGDYGEVYVLDWGIAVSLEKGLAGVPPAREVAAIEGTPAYMAPEMAAGDGELIGVRTDVYLLGAVLHEIITGRPPHEGDGLVAMLTQAFASDPVSYPPTTPREIVEICHRAMARHPDERYASAALFAAALDEFVVHRSSTQLSDEAELRLEALCGLVARAMRGDELEIMPVYTTFRECRFAFSQALRSWPENAAARGGLQRALELMIGFELSRDAPHAAATLLAELPEPVATLSGKVERAMERWRHAQSKLEALERDADLTIGQHIRRPVTFGLAFLWAGACITCGLLTRADIVTVEHTAFALVNLAFAVGVAASAWAGRAFLLTNTANRRLSATAVIVFGTYVALWLLCGQLGLSMPTSAAIHVMFGTAMWFAAAINVERRWLPIALGSLLGLALVLPLPAHYFEILGITGGLGSLAAALLNRPGRAEAPSSSLRPERPKSAS